MSSSFQLHPSEVDARRRPSDAIALHVLLAVTDPALRATVLEELTGSMPAVVDAVEDIAECAAALHEAPYDVVIADTDVAGFEDPMLLRLARDTQPSALRIGIVGRSQPDVALSMLAHMAVSRDDIGGLGGRVRRAAALQRALEDPIVRAQIAQCQVLPSAPTLYAQLATVLAHDEVAITDVVEVVVQDQEVSARVLQLTNSAFTGRIQPTTDLAVAIAYVGIPAVRGLVLTMEVLRAFRRHDADVVTELALRLSAHGRDVAEAARTIAPTEKEAFSAGLLHDIGKLVLAANDPDGWLVVESLVAAGRTHAEAESRVFGCTHAAVGASLLAAWGLPEGLVNAIAHHHEPGEDGDEVGLSGVIHVADALTYDRTWSTRLDHEWVERAGLTNDVQRWRAQRHAPGSPTKRNAM